jgi:hypothetical protein
MEPLNDQNWIGSDRTGARTRLLPFVGCGRTGWTAPRSGGVPSHKSDQCSSKGSKWLHDERITGFNRLGHSNASRSGGSWR